MRTPESLYERRRRLEAEETLILDATEEVLRVLAEKGLSRADLARKLRRSEAHVSRLLSGERNMTLRTLARISAALGVKIALEFR